MFDFLNLRMTVIAFYFQKLVSNFPLNYSKMVREFLFKLRALTTVAIRDLKKTRLLIDKPEKLRIFPFSKNLNISLVSAKRQRFFLYLRCFVTISYRKYFLSPFLSMSLKSTKVGNLRGRALKPREIKRENGPKY